MTHLLFEKIERFFERIKKINVIKFFLLTWIVHFSWTVVVGMTLTEMEMQFKIIRYSTMFKVIILSVLWFAGIYLIWAFRNSDSEFEEINVNEE